LLAKNCNTAEKKRQKMAYTHKSRSLAKDCSFLPITTVLFDVNGYRFQHTWGATVMPLQPSS
jgi:hypothetical protein